MYLEFTRQTQYKELRNLLTIILKNNTMKTYTIKITGSGTAEQISQRLYEVAANLYNSVHTIWREDPLNIEMEAEDDILFTEIAKQP